jgi:hypothetical protein
MRSSQLFLRVAAAVKRRMNGRRASRLTPAATLWMLLFATSAFAQESPVKLLRVPDNGIQPQAAVDSSGAVQLIYFKGDPKAGDVFYVRQMPGQTNFSAPIRVNSRLGSVIAIGTIRGAQMALGKNNRVHVSWMGSDKAEPVMIRDKKATPMLYSRLNDSGNAFEPERNVLIWAAGLDGGGSVAADEKGNAYVAWHATPPDNKAGEAGRAVFVAESHDEGKTFAAEKQANTDRTGACGCCGMKAFADRTGNLYLLYRAATDILGRDMTLLGRTGRADFERVTLGPWKLPTCPMSSASLVSGSDVTYAAWETQNQVQFANVTSTPTPISPSGTGKRKHPSIAVNKKGTVLLAWTENTGWDKGGSLAWQEFTQDGKPIGERGRADGVPVWSLVSAIALPDNSFAIYY